MRYTPVLVLSTLAVAEAAGHNARHASFHARRQVEKRTPGDYDNVNWAALSYDLSTVNWNSVFGKPAATPAATPAAQKQAENVPPANTPAPEPPAPTPPAPKPSASQPEQPSQSQGGSYNGNNDFTKDIKSFFGNLNVNTDSANSESPSANIWLGKSSAWKAKFVNGGSEGIYMTCWSKNQGGPYSGMSIDKQPPLIAGYLAPGAEQYVSFAENFPSVCAPLEKSTKLAIFGGVDNTWWEATFVNLGKFDVSRNVNMHGTNIYSKGSKCTSSMDQCVFKCASDVAACTTGYDLYNCGASNGGGGGYDPEAEGTGGGCDMGATGEEVTVTFG